MVPEILDEDITARFEMEALKGKVRAAVALLCEYAEGTNTQDWIESDHSAHIYAITHELEKALGDAV